MFKQRKFESQAKALLILIASGFLLICIIAILALNGLKNNYDSSLAERFHKAEFLQDVEQFYTTISHQESKDELEKKYQIMLQDWENYKNYKPNRSKLSAIKGFYQNLFLAQESQEIQELESRIQQALQELDTTILQTQTLIQSIDFNSKKDIYDLLEYSMNTNSKISNIFRIQIQISLLQDTIIDSLYAATLWLLLSFMVLVTFITLYFASLILRFVRGINLELQDTIQRQTKALKESNVNLQKTIDSEIEQSRQKDRIMYQQARLASMGEMIQNIAHQWRQPLNSLIILIQNFAIKYENNTLSDEFVATQTQDALRIAKNMSDTIENFRNFFQPNIQKSIFCVAKSIQDSIRLIYPTLEQNNIKIFFDAIDSKIEIYGYENAFSQIVLNIIKNSQDIFIDRLEKQSKNKQDTQDTQGVIEVVLQEHNNQACLSIMDNGGGVKTSDINKIFEPYFTTKHKSVGTGIGLYMVKEIVEKQMQGSIEVINQEWKCPKLNKTFFGAIFMIRFPIILEEVDNEKIQ